MNRSRMIGVLAVLAASFVAGCGGASTGGHIAAQEAPASSDPAAAATATAPAEDPTTKALGAFPEADPNQPTLRNLDRFSESRAGTVFQEPASVAAASTSSDSSATPDATGTGGATSSGDSGTAQEPAPAPSDTSSPSTGGTTTTGSAPSSGDTTTSGSTTTGGGTTSGSKNDTKKADSYTANMEVDGAPVIAKVDTKVPTATPYFVVASIDADKVVLRLISGSFGTGDTVDIAKGASVTLSNPSSGSTIVIKVVDIAKAGATK